MDSGAESIRVCSATSKDDTYNYTGEVRTVKATSLLPEDRWLLLSTPKFKFFGGPASNGSALAVSTVTPEQTFCSGDEVKIKARQDPSNYKVRKGTLPLLVLGSYVAKKNASGPTMHVSRVLDFAILFSQGSDATAFGL